MQLIVPVIAAWAAWAGWLDAASPDAARARTVTVAPVVQQEADEQPSDARVNPSQPDFTLVALPTTLRVPARKSAFRVTHRFTRPLGQGDFGDLAGDFFGLDSGSQIGLEFRFGLLPGGQIGIHRTNDKTIQFFGQYDLLRQGPGRPFGLAAYGSIDGTNNFKDSYSPAIGAIVSRELGRHGALYVSPIWVNNSNLQPSELVDDNDTLLVGVGARLRVRPTVYVVAEIAPRVSGFDPGANQASVAIEKRVGGHAFQINFSNAFGTTMAQIARGGQTQPDGDSNWYLGFNISRKFF
ncbi:MAG TPA: DUF5777 family beta-barrel protein [Vicinamibacterales bacterium]|nr:DUF5777 family beta-barrel protein [Vicinamibacterales bacterium]